MFFLVTRIKEDFVEDFLHGFIQAVDGEKDPRCLVLVFELSEKIALTLPLKHLSEVGCFSGNHISFMS